MRFAVLPAAGKSTRMGQPKLALPLGNHSLLEHVLAALRQAEVEHIVVVVGPHVSELAMLAAAAGALVCQLAAETADMRRTVEYGLDWLEAHFQPRAEDAWLLVPADHPLLSPSAIRELGQARSKHSNHSIFVPTFEGRRGHPLLLSWQHVAGIRAHPSGQGLNTYVRDCAAQTLEVAVTSETILWDVDTPQDYEQLRHDGMPQP